MSRIFKSNYVKVGTPKAIKQTMPPIIKHEEPKPVENLVEKAENQANTIIQDAKELYLKIIEEANQEAKRILDKAHEERTALEANAGEEGYQNGYNAGFSEGMNQAQNIIDQAVEVKRTLDASRASLYQEAEPEIMDMVLDIARKVIGDELVQDSKAILSIIRQAINRCAFKDKLTIRVSEQDYEFVNSNRDYIIMLTEGINDLDIHCDKALPKGGCIVETPAGEINAGVNVQMNEIQKAFEFIMRNE